MARTKAHPIKQEKIKKTFDDKIKKNKNNKQQININPKMLTTDLLLNEVSRKLEAFTKPDASKLTEQFENLEISTTSLITEEKNALHSPIIPTTTPMNLDEDLEENDSDSNIYIN